jgi:hypothetical protein
VPVSTRGARSGVQRLGCKQPVGVVEAPIPHPSRPAGRIQQGAQVTKPISPVRIGKLGGGHAAVVREIAVPKGDCGKDTGYGERVESAKDRAAKIADPAQSDCRAGEIQPADSCVSYRPPPSTGVLRRLHHQSRTGLSVAAATDAVVPPTARDKVVGCYRGTRQRLPIRKGDAGARVVAWGGAAVVLGAEESSVHGEGQQGWRTSLQPTGGN